MIRRPDAKTWAQRARERPVPTPKPANDVPEVIDLAAWRQAVRRQEREQVREEREDLVGAYEAEVDRGMGRRILRTWV